MKGNFFDPEPSDRTSAEVLRELDELRRQLLETGERRRGPKSELLGRQFPMPGIDDARALLLEQVRDGACVVSAEGNIILCNRAFAHQLGQTVDALVGTLLFSNLKDKGRDIERKLTAAWSAGENVEATFLHSDGSERRVVVLGRRTLLYGFKAFCLVTRDLTEELTLAAIVQSDALSRIVFEQAAEPVVVCDAGGKILRANRRAIDLAGAIPELCRIDECFAFSGFADGAVRPNVAAPVERWLREPKHAPLEVDVAPPDGKPVRTLLTAGPIHNAGGAFLGWVITFTDISIRVAAEKESRDWAARESELNEELRRQAAELTEKNRELEQFALAASHDLQEPLRKINSFGDLLQEGKELSERSRDFVERMKLAAHRMSLMIDDLLQYARAGTENQVFETVDTEAVMRGVLLQLDAQIEKAGIQITVGPLPKLRSSRTLLPHVLLNLVNNAIKYRGKKDPWVRVSAERKGSAWEFAVADNGIGIDPRYFDRIFRIFERLHSRTQYMGTGIGLAICKRIVERLGGRIWLESALGAGSTFRFTLPDAGPPDQRPMSASVDRTAS